MNGNGRRSQFISNLLILLMFCIIDDLKEEFVFILAISRGLKSAQQKRSITGFYILMIIKRNRVMAKFVLSLEEPSATHDPSSLNIQAKMIYVCC